jgi:hypothetical protein
MGRSLLVAVLIALALAVGVNYALDFQRAKSDSKSLSTIESSLILPERVQSAEKSVFFVQGAYKFSATAFLIDNKCGVFATNAHVAEAVAEVKDPVELEQASTGKSVKVNGYRIHPARALFDKLVDQYGPVSVFSNGLVQAIPVGSAYDVGLLFTKGLDCSTGDDVSAFPALKLASPATLGALHAGDPIVSIGFPGNGTTTKEVEDITALARVEIGHVRALGSYVPVSGDAKVEREMILHTLSTTHGTSGSPILNYAGEVIAVNQGAAGASSTDDLLTRERIGHRADALTDLIDKSPDDQITTKYSARIGAMLGTHFSAAAALSYLGANDLPERVAKALGAEVETVKTDPVKATFGELVTEFTTPATTGWNTPTTIATGGRYFITRTALEPDKAYAISALDYDPNVDGHLCPLRIGYRFSEGAASFVWTSELTKPALLVRPGDASRMVEYFVWRHPDCSENSLAFDIALTEFKVKAPSAPATSFVSTARHFLAQKWQDLREQFWGGEIRPPRRPARS